MCIYTETMHEDVWDSLFNSLILTNVISWIPISCTRTPARTAPRNDLWSREWVLFV